MTIELIMLCLSAFVMEIIDAGLGMGYGTVLSPLLIASGIPALVVVPSILLSQAIGGLIAAIFHHNLGNAFFGFDIKKLSLSKDLKNVLIISSLGVFAAVLGAFIAVNIPKIWLKIYIGILVVTIGVIMLSGIALKFSWKKMIGLGILSAFNKGISGGGYGPIVTGGQVILGKECKSSVGCTAFAEVPICLAGFITFLFTNGITNWKILGVLCIGAALGAPFGSLLTKKVNTTKLKIIVATLITVLGIMLLLGLTKSV